MRSNSIANQPAFEPRGAFAKKSAQVRHLATKFTCHWMIFRGRYSLYSAKLPGRNPRVACAVLKSYSTGDDVNQNDRELGINLGPIFLSWST